MWTGYNLCIVSHFCVHRPVRGVIRDPGVTGQASLHNGIVVQVLLAVFQKTAHPRTSAVACAHTRTHMHAHTHTRYYCISPADHKS